MSETYIILSLYFFGILIGIGFGYILGVYRERKAWNKLIDDGILPKPKLNHPFERFTPDKF